MAEEFLNEDFDELDNLDMSDSESTDIDDDTLFNGSDDEVNESLLGIDLESIESSSSDHISEDDISPDENKYHNLRSKNSASRIVFRGSGRCTCRGCQCPGFVSKDYVMCVIIVDIFMKSIGDFCNNILTLNT